MHKHISSDKETKMSLSVQGVNCTDTPRIIVIDHNIEHHIKHQKTSTCKRPITNVTPTTTITGCLILTDKFLKNKT